MKNDDKRIEFFGEYMQKVLHLLPDFYVVAPSKMRTKMLKNAVATRGCFFIRAEDDDDWEGKMMPGKQLYVISEDKKDVYFLLFNPIMKKQMWRFNFYAHPRSSLNSFDLIVQMIFLEIERGFILCGCRNYDGVGKIDVISPDISAEEMQIKIDLAGTMHSVNVFKTIN